MDKRVLIAVTVDDSWDVHSLADLVDHTFRGGDATVWKWEDFFADVRDGVLGPDGDATALAARELCELCACPADGVLFGFTVCRYHGGHGDANDPCPHCGRPMPPATGDIRA